MKTKRFLLSSVLALAIGSLITLPASAIVAYSDASGLAGNQTAGPFLFGNVFTVGSSAVNVTALGAFDNGGTGSFGANGVNVAIYSVTVGGGNTLTVGSLVANALASFNGSGYTLSSGNYAFNNVSGVTLNAGGTYMVVADNYGVGTGNSLGYNASTAVGSANHQAIVENTGGGLISYDGGFYHNNGIVTGLGGSSGWAFQTTGLTGYATYGAGNFVFAPVPEAGLFGIAAVALLGMVYAGRGWVLRRRFSVA